MAELAVPALIAGTALAATSQVMQGREQSRSAAFEQEQLRTQEQVTRTAAAQDETKRLNELTSSLETIAAIRAGRGVGGTSPTGMAIFDSVTEDAERDIGVSKSAYATRADMARRTGEMAGGKAKTSLLAGYLSAGATVADAGFKYSNAGLRGGRRS